MQLCDGLIYTDFNHSRGPGLHSSVRGQRSYWWLERIWLWDAGVTYLPWFSFTVIQLLYKLFPQAVSGIKWIESAESVEIVGPRHHQGDENITVRKIPSKTHNTTVCVCVCVSMLFYTLSTWYCSEMAKGKAENLDMAIYLESFWFWNLVLSTIDDFGSRGGRWPPKTPPGTRVNVPALS